MSQPRMLFLNLPVQDLERSMAFFASLGFDFDRRFTDDKCACMILDDRAAFVMLLAEPFFRTFTDKRLCDPHTQAEGLFALSCGDRAEVDALTERAVAAGGTVARPPKDHGFMYTQAFYDLDGHQWELVWMDVRAAQGDA